MKKRFKLSIFFLLALVLTATVAFGQVAQLFEEQGVSPRDTAMGNAFVGVANDYTAAYYNPAGLFQVQKTHISIGYKYIQPQVYLRMPVDFGVKFADYPNTKLITIGLTSDLNFPRFLNPRITERISFGLAIAISNYLKSFTTYLAPSIPYFPRYGERMVPLLSIYASVSVKITDWLAAGVGMVPSTDTKVNVASITKTDLGKVEWKTTQNVTSRSATIARPLVGLLVKPPFWWFRDHMSVGLVWRDRVMAIDGSGHSTAYTHLKFPDGTEYQNLPAAVDSIYGLTGYSPQQVVFGLGIYPIKGMTIALDEIWKQWSGWMNYMEKRPNPRWEDTFQTRLGIEHQWSFAYSWLYSFSARAGWYYEPSPAPDRPSEWNLLDNDKHVFSSGLGMEIGHILGLFMAPVSFDLAYQHQLLEPRRDANSGDDPFPEIKYGGYLYALSASFTFKF